MQEGDNVMILDWLRRWRKSRPQSRSSSEVASNETNRATLGLGHLLQQSLPAPREAVLLDIRNNHGSVEHFYHFILGFLAPILLQSTEDLLQPQIVRSCGPLDAHIRALDLPQIEIVSKAKWTELRSARHPTRILRGFDDPGDFDAAKFERLRQVVISRLGVSDGPQTDTILVVGRGRSPDYYQSDSAEVKTSANLRRSIPNMTDIVRAIQDTSAAVEYAELEEIGLKEQVALFARSRTVIAQHGAALVHVLWMKPKGHVIEVNPKARNKGPLVQVFATLSEVCGHTHHSIAQSSPHAPIDSQAILAALGDK